MSEDIGGFSSLKLWFQYEVLHLRGTRESFSGHHPNSKSYKAQPHPTTHLQTSPPNRHVSPENRGHFPPHLPQLLSPEILVPYFERSKFWGASLTFGVQEKRDAPVASLASFLSAGSRTGECPGEGDPHKRALEGFLHSQSELGTPPQNPSQPIRLQLGGRGSCIAPVRFPQHYIPHPI